MNTTYFLNLISGNIFRSKTEPGIPAQYYIGLSSTEPQLDGTGVAEPSADGTGYARVPLNSLSEPNQGAVSNREILSFPSSLSAWGTMTHYIIFDAATGGNVLMYGALKTSRTVEADTVLSINAGDLELVVTNPA